ncbi:MAG: dihydropteroate synthase [Anaerofustis sp.]
MYILNEPKIIPMHIGKRTLRFGTRSFIMGILNVTPDSFSDGGDFSALDAALAHAKEMIADGADIIDVGGESSRPGYTEVSAEEEMRRVLPIIKKLATETDVLISIDTMKASVAEAALQAGAHILNDVWGLQRDGEMAYVAAKYDAPIVVMHNQDGTEYDRPLMDEMIRFFEHTFTIADQAGLSRENLILDPGVGFGKDFEQNLETMRNLAQLREMGYPVLLGTSRKRMLGTLLDVPPKERTEGTVATTVIGIMQGMDIFRVHDVKENAQAAKVTDVIVRKTHG